LLANSSSSSCSFFSFLQGEITHWPLSRGPCTDLAGVTIQKCVFEIPYIVFFRLFAVVVVALALYLSTFILFWPLSFKKHKLLLLLLLLLPTAATCLSLLLLLLLLPS